MTESWFPTYIFFTADINKQTVSQLRIAIVPAFNQGCKELHLMISSNGGDVLEGLTIASVIRALPLKVITHNIGVTDSVANVIFAAGDERYAQSNASFLFHGVTLNFPECRLVESQLLEQYKNCQRLREDMIKNFSFYSGVDLPVASELMVDGAHILSAQDAQLKGIIHAIRDPQIPYGTQVISIGNN